MNQQEIKSSLQNIQHTMELIDVKGKENLSHMLGCIYLLEKVILAVDTLVDKPADQEESEDEDHQAE